MSRSSSIRPIIRRSWPSLPPMTARLLSPRGGRWRPRPSPQPPPMTRRSRRGWRARRASRSPRPWSSPPGWRRGRATARTRIRRPPSIGPARPGPGSRARGNCRARSCPTTITPTPTPLSSWSPNSPARRSPSSSTPIPAASPSAPCVAWEKALACDPVSAFGGVVALNRPLDAATAAAIARIFVEVVIAPAVDEEAAAVLAAKPGLRLLVTGGLPDPAAPGQSLRSLAGGLLVQQRDARLCRREELRTVTRRAPSEAEIADLLFAEAVAKHVKSNAIVFARDGATVGIGAGQMSRVDSVVIAAQKAAQAGRAAGLAAPPTAGSVVASDAFFPFADGVEAAIAAGATAILQPGGSRRDAEIIAAADKAGVAMVFTGTRHFRH